MEGILLNVLGESTSQSNLTCPLMPLKALDEHMWFLQANTIKKTTSHTYATGAQDYITFCISHGIPLDPTPETLS
jgi:hypothetical protein